MPKFPPINIAEELLSRHLQDAKIAFVREHYYATPRELRADFWLLGTDLLIEVQGGIYTRQSHGSITGVLADIDRLNQATLNRFRMLRFTPEQIMDGIAIEFIKEVVK